MKAWHWVGEDRRLRYGDNRVVRAGHTYKAKGKGSIVLCQNGVHGSKRILDGLCYAPGPVVCRVNISGEIVQGSDKLAGRTRDVLWLLDASAVLHEFACRCADTFLARITHPDPRSIEGIRVKRAWLRGEATDSDLAFASAAAWDAAWAAASTAARASASAAAWASAWASASAAVWAAAGAATWAAASTAAQNRTLTGMVVAAHKKSAGGPR